uniref:Uncharacterized protein n=1 Tax=Panagrolaimus sp. JU765 TaxID=591449 RepID=A0AC34Q7V0_9BILA
MDDSEFSEDSAKFTRVINEPDNSECSSLETESVHQTSANSTENVLNIEQNPPNDDQKMNNSEEKKEDATPEVKPPEITYSRIFKLAERELYQVLV